MNSLADRLHLSQKMVQLLDAAGCGELADLAGREAKELHAALLEANEQLKLHRTIPAVEKVALWIDEARELQEVSSPAEDELVNFEFDPDVLEMIAASPVAVPVSGKSLAVKGVPVSAIPEAILLTAARGDISIRATVKGVEKTKDVAEPAAVAMSTGSHVNQISFAKRKKEEVNLTRVRSTAEFLDPNVENAFVEDKSKAEDRLRLLRAALPETNRGVDPNSRRYIRGVLHSHPRQVYWGAWVTIACHFFIPAGILAAVFLLLKDNGNPSFAWVPQWFLAFPLGVFVFGFLYLTLSYSATCRICGQRCFVPKNCLKNRKAHHIRLLGYVLSVALHIVLFRWFRCTFCGTPVRLKQ
jgi:hypothetical protein